MSSGSLLIYPESVSDFKGVSEFSEHRKDKDVLVLYVCLSPIASFISFPFEHPPPPRPKPENVFVAHPSFICFSFRLEKFKPISTLERNLTLWDIYIHIYTTAKKKSWRHSVADTIKWTKKLRSWGYLELTSKVLENHILILHTNIPKRHHKRNLYIKFI